MRNINYIYGTTVDLKQITFDGFCVESYTWYLDNQDRRCVEVNFISGKTIRVFSKVNESVYPGECMETLIDACICRYFNDSEEE